MGSSKDCPEPLEELLRATHDLVAKHLERTAVDTKDLARLIAEVRGALVGEQPKLEAGKVPMARPVVAPTGSVDASKVVRLGDGGLGPAVPIAESVKPAYLVCLEDGEQRQMLKKWLATAYRITPEQYRKRWGLPDDYPMIAAAAAKAKSRIARKQGLGRRPPLVKS
jgi:predicted transcriptional regulator